MSTGDQSPFRFLFWGLISIMVMASSGPTLFFLMRGHWGGNWPGMLGGPLLGLHFPSLLPVMLLTAIYVALVGGLVYRDSRKRGMDPWLWATIAVFIPAFIGVIIYLIVRSAAGRACLKCGKSIQADYWICPYCGHAQDLNCPQCRQSISADWRVCPHCEQPLGSAPAPASPVAPPSGNHS